MSDKTVKMLVWCMGFMGKTFAEFITTYPVKKYRIIGYTDSNRNISGGGGEFYGYPVYSLDEISELDCDCVMVANEQEDIFYEIKKYIKDDLKLDLTVLNHKKAMNLVRTERILIKYRQSEDPEIQETLRWLQNHEISVRNQRENTEKVCYEICYDDDRGGFPYVNFKGKRMYYPKDYKFEMKNGKHILTNIVECDQYAGSPHLYADSSHKIRKGDVIVDAGVAEGNFTLTYIDEISKAYLIESNQKWLDVLKLTFAPYKQKIVFVPRNLSDEDTEDSITLDTVVENNKIDFIKMDIEGMETRALLGGMNLLRNNPVKLSVCTYHRKRDKEYVQFILESLGYTVSHTEGYMFFLYDPDIDKTLDFRRGVIHASKYC